MINVYPSQDNPTNQTLWIFSGSSTAINSTIRTSGSFSPNDTWDSYGMYNANVPTNQTLSLSSLFSSSNTDDIESVRVRTAGVWGAGSPFANNATNTPTITIGSGSRTIANFWMNNSSAGNTFGIRVSSSALSASPGNAVTWTGAGLLNKPIGDFNAGTFNNNGTSGPWFAGNGANRIRITVNNQVIPEPEEYAFVFGLFALAFVFFHRYRQQKKQRRQAATS